MGYMKHLNLTPWIEVNGISAASGLYQQGNQLFMVADNSTFLYQYQIDNHELQRIPLVNQAAESIKKAEKLDLEAISLFNNVFYILGSGSTHKRQQLFCYDMQHKLISQHDLSAVYAQCRQLANLADDQLNIEGLAHDGKHWLLLQRGQGVDQPSAIFILEGDIRAEIQVKQYIPIALPSIGSVPCHFTDGVVYEGQLYFLAAGEDTVSTYDDGAVVGSLFGSIDLASMQLTECQQLPEQHKFEGLALHQIENYQMSFLLCEDADRDDTKSIIYRLDVIRDTED